jgi:23S rRNA pseudouridine2457 synthase
MATAAPTASDKTYIRFYKPFGVLSQFTDESGRPTLADFGPFPSGVYPIGRLDAESEGLLILSNDNQLKHRLLEPKFGHTRTYIVQVENIPNDESLRHLRSGVLIERKRTKEAHVRLLNQEPEVPPRPVPIRFRKHIPTAWLEIKLTEGRNRQVRKMTAAVGHPTLRLLRVGQGPISLTGLAPGEHRKLSPQEVQLLRKSVGL